MFSKEVKGVRRWKFTKNMFANVRMSEFKNVRKCLQRRLGVRRWEI